VVVAEEEVAVPVVELAVLLEEEPVAVETAVPVAVEPLSVVTEPAPRSWQISLEIFRAAAH
jgi:hypothetical protein